MESGNMTEAQTDVIAYLDSKELSANIYKYQVSPLEAVTKDSIPTLFSSESRRLTQHNERFQLYNENGGLYVDKVPFEEFYQKIVEIQDGKTPAEDNDDHAVNYEMIMSLISYLQSKNYSVWGNNQRGYDNWEVLNDHYLNLSVYRAQKTGQQQLFMTQDDHGETYLVDADDNKVLIRNNNEPNLSEQDNSDYYELRKPDGKVILENIPLRRLGLVLLAIVNGFNVEQVKSQFIWPKLSDTLIADARLLFERNFCSEPQEIKTMADLKSVDELPIISDEDHIVSKYRFLGQELKWFSKIAFTAEDLPDVFDSLYHNFLIDSTDISKALSDFLVELGESNNQLILRQEQMFLNAGQVDQFLIGEDGGVQISAAQSHDDAIINQVTSVFTILDKTSEKVVQRELTIDELVAYLWENGK